MEIPAFIAQSARRGSEIRTIEMHTTGEPTRIVYSGFPDLSGTLLEQRTQARSHHDRIRRSIICEPRGHREMYGAVLRPQTELVQAGRAHMGVLFLTNDGYSTMCGHATLAVARLLVDHVGSGSSLMSLGGLQIEVEHDRDAVEVFLHVPCGLVRVTVPTLRPDVGGFKTDASRPISYLSVPSYATGVSTGVPIPPSLRWPELGDKKDISVDVAYGGAFYIVVSPAGLGFSNSLAKPDLSGLSRATRLLKEAFNGSEQLRKAYLQHAEHPELQFLYGTIVTDSSLGAPAANTAGGETGLCFFSDAQLDRSPTGSGVQARVALGCAKGQRKLHERWTYHSLVSNHFSGEGAFVGEAVEEIEVGGQHAVIVKVEGWARYTGACTFVVEEDDGIGEGFWFDGLGRESGEA